MDNTVSTDSKIAWYSVFKPSWYIDQMKGWSIRSYFLLILGVGLIVGMTIGGGYRDWETKHLTYYTKKET